MRLRALGVMGLIGGVVGLAAEVAHAEPRPIVYFISGKQGFPGDPGGSVCGQPKLRDLMFFGNQDDSSVPGFQRSLIPSYVSPLQQFLTSADVFTDESGNGAEIVAVSWNCFRGDNGATGELDECSCTAGGAPPTWYKTAEWNPANGNRPPGPGGHSTGWTRRAHGNDLNSLRFLATAARVLNDEMPTGRRLILIGHSAGGDTILQGVAGLFGTTAPITRPVTAAIVIDPVSKSGEPGGIGARLTSRVPPLYGIIPANVELFINRWQENNTGGGTTPACPYCLTVNLPVNSPAGQPWSDGRFNPNLRSVYSDNTGLSKLDGALIINQRKVTFFEDAPGVGAAIGTPPAPKLYRANHGTMIDALASMPNGKGGGLGVNRDIADTLKTVLNRRLIVALTVLSTSKHLQATDGGGGGVSLSTSNLGLWEHFELVNLTDPSGALHDGDQVRFAATTGHWLGADSMGNYKANRQKAANEETFTVLRVDSNGASLPGAIHSDDLIHIRDDSQRFMCRNPSNSSVESQPAPNRDCRFRITLHKGTRMH